MAYNRRTLAFSLTALVTMKGRDTMPAPGISDCPYLILVAYDVPLLAQTATSGIYTSPERSSIHGTDQLLSKE